VAVKQENKRDEEGDAAAEKWGRRCVGDKAAYELHGWLAAVATMQPLLSLVSMRNAGVFSIWRQLDRSAHLSWHDRFFQNVMFFSLIM
jgi:hypothetical protein